MPTIQNIIEPMQTVLRDATAIAGKTSGFIRRPAMGKMSAETFVTSLVFACMGERQPTLDDFAANSATMGAPVSPQAFDDRFSLRAVACLRQVLETARAQRIVAEPRAVPLLERFTGVYLADCTVLDLPDDVAALWPNTAALARKLPVSLDYSTGGLWLHPPQNVHQHDSATPLQRQIVPVGALRVADLGFYDVAVLRDYGSVGVYWLSRLKTNAVVYTDAGQAWTIDAAVAAQPDAHVFDLPVIVGNSQMLPCRLVALRHTPEAADPNPPAWHLYITNCPPPLVSVAAIRTLYTLRWQIELLFKHWKAENVLRAWRTVRPCRILCEVYARLIALLITHWATVLTIWDNPAASLSRAARILHHWAIPLLLVYCGGVLPHPILARLESVLRHARPIASGQATLATHQRLLYPSAPPPVPKPVPLSPSFSSTDFA